jgi:hypothetical protein
MYDKIYSLLTRTLKPLLFSVTPLLGYTPTMTDKSYMANHPHSVRCLGITLSGAQCKLTALPGRQVCKWHGGKTTVLPLTPQQKNGHSISAHANNTHTRYKFASNLQNSYEAMIGNRAELLDSTDEIALLMVRVQTILDIGSEQPVVSEEAFKAYSDFLAARAAGNVNDLQRAFGKLDVAMENARDTHNVMQEFIPVMEQLRKFRETEMKRRMAQRQMLSIEDARRFFHSIQTILLEALTMISNEEEQYRVKKHFADRIEQIFASPKGATTEQDLRNHEHVRT